MVDRRMPSLAMGKTGDPRVSRGIQERASCRAEGNTMRSRGISLVQIMIALVSVTIIAAIVIPNVLPPSADRCLLINTATGEKWWDIKDVNLRHYGDSISFTDRDGLRISISDYQMVRYRKDSPQQLLVEQKYNKANEKE